MASAHCMTTYRRIKGYPDYRIGNDGSVWTHKQSKVWKRRKPTQDDFGHMRIHLRKNGRTTTKRVHQLVLEAFIGPCPDGMECCHEDGNPANNRLTNLRWDTHQSNMADRKRHGNTAKGEKNGRAKISARDADTIRRKYKRGNTTYRKLAREYDIDHTAIGAIIRNETWT